VPRIDLRRRRLVRAAAFGLAIAGRAGYQPYTKDFAKFIWQLASPQWRFDDSTFERSAAAFDNPDHVAVVIHNYRWRLGLADSEAHYDELEVFTTLSAVAEAGPTIRERITAVNG
jgi:hypothetical protein